MAGSSSDDEPTGHVEELEREELFFELLRAVEDDDVPRAQGMLCLMCPSEVAQLDPRPGRRSHGLAPIHLCTSREMAESLLDFGVPANLLGACNVTPLFTSVVSPDVVRLLLEHDAKVEAANTDGATPLHHAVLNDMIESARLLLQAGADVNRQDCRGNCCLHMVSSLEMAKFLVEHGADLTCANENGSIPLEEAVAKGRHMASLDTAAYLLDQTLRTQRSRAQLLLDALTKRVADGDLAKGAEKDLGEQVVTIRSTASSGSLDEEKVAFDDEGSLSAQDKWRSVKRHVLAGQVRHVRLRQPRSSERRPRLSSSDRPAFAKSTATRDCGTARVARIEFFQSFFELMVRDRPELALALLNKQRTLLYQRHGSRTYAYNFDLIGTPLRCTTAVKTMVRYERFELLAHPVTQWQITAKFILFARYLLFAELLITVTFLALMTVTFSSEPGHLATWTEHAKESSHSSNEATAIADRFGAIAMLAAWSLLQVINLRFVLDYMLHWHMVVRGVHCNKQKTSELLFGGRGHLGRFYLLPHIFLIVREYLLRAGASAEFVPLARALSSVTFLLIFARALSIAEGLYEQFGLTISTIRRMFLDCKQYFGVLLLFIGAFTVALNMLYADSQIEDFAGIENTFFTLFFFVFNLDTGQVQHDANTARRLCALTLLAAYMVVVVLTVVNLIIAVYTNTFETISRAAREQAVLTRARFVILMEEHAGVMASFRNSFMHSRCPKKNQWFDWEKKHVLGRTVLVRENHDGKVVIDTQTSIMRMMYQQRAPPFFLWSARLFERLSDAVMPMPFAEGSPWTDFKTDGGASQLRHEEHYEGPRYGSIPSTDSSRDSDPIRLGYFLRHDADERSEPMPHAQAQHEDDLMARMGRLEAKVKSALAAKMETQLEAEPQVESKTCENGE